MKKIVLMYFLLALGSSVWAQERTVSGRVTSADDGSPLPGVNVILKGTSNGTATDADGNYRLSGIPASGGALIFSFIGLQTIEVEIGDRATVDVALSLDVTQLSEVVVTALGVTRETKSLPYASQQVKAENLNITQSIDVKSALAGKVAGVQVLGQAGSKLGEFGGIRIRGAASLTQDKEPLYILDGVPIANPNDIDVNNIESVNVLKGPNATAMYGQRADAGVVLLTSKKGTRGAGLSVEWQSSTVIDKVAQLPKMQNRYGGGYDGEDSWNTLGDKWVLADDYGVPHLTMADFPDMWQQFAGKRYLAWDNNYADESWGPKFDGQEYVPWYAWWPGTAENPNPYFGKTAKYVAQPDNVKNFYQTGVTAKNTISVYGGGNNYNLNLAYTNLNQKGITPFTDFTKHYLMANTEFDPSSKLKIASNIRYSTSEINGDFTDDYGNQTSGSFNSWFSRGVDTKIMKELKDLTTPDGYSTSWNWWGPDYYAYEGGGYKKPAFWFNPFTFMEHFKRIQKSENLSGSLNASYSITKELSVNVLASRNITEYKRDYFVPFFLSNSSAPELYNSWSNSFGRYRRTETENNFAGDIRYKKIITDFDISALVGGNLRHNTYQRFVADMPIDAKTGGLIIPDVFTYSNAGIPPVPTTYEWQKKVNSIYANASIGWKGMAYVDVGVRRDWDSALPATKNGYTYSSVGANFIFSEVLNSLDFLSFGKVRASWAQVGSDVDPLLLEPVYTTGTQAFQGDKIMMYTPNTLVDPNLTTPLSTSVEGGFDIRFLENRLGLSFTYYSEVRKDDILPIQIPSSTGHNSYVTNAGQTTRKGVEISLDGDVFKSPTGLNWNVLFNFGSYNTVVDELPAGQQSMNAPGGAGAFGFVTMTHELGNKWGQLRGTAIKRDANGNPILNANGTYAVEFNQYLGSVIPDFAGGLVNTLSYKGVSLIVSIDYQKGGNFFSLTEQWGGYSGLTEETAAINDRGFNVRDDVAEGGGVRVIGVDAGGTPVDTYIPALRYFGQFYGNRLAEPYVHDASFIKLRDVSISYDLKQKLSNVKFIKGAVISVVGRNLALLAVSKDNVHRWDPSIMSQRYGENGQLPGTRSYGVNLTLRF